jgi:heptosyltransferase-1
MGDIIHTLPAVASLKHSFPGSHLTWAIESKWMPLLEQNPFVDQVAELRRAGPRQILASCRDLRLQRYDFAVDFQGLLKSSLLATIARPDKIYGFHRSQVREKPAALFYSSQIQSASVHVVERNLDLASAAGAVSLLRMFALPAGKQEGHLPSGGFILANPLAGWRSKQWPLEFYQTLAERIRRELGIPLVLNAPPDAQVAIASVRGALPHASGLPGLIDATRRAIAVVGVDSGPLHLAAGLGKPGVAIFGPTDPARNGPYGETFTVLRSPNAVTTYKRASTIDAGMWEISPDDVFAPLKAIVARQTVTASPPPRV